MKLLQAVPWAVTQLARGKTLENIPAMIRDRRFDPPFESLAHRRQPRDPSTHTEAQDCGTFVLHLALAHSGVVDKPGVQGGLDVVEDIVIVQAAEHFPNVHLLEGNTIAHRDVVAPDPVEESGTIATNPS